jgi:DNA (cytosine-5)-methyltransferase 1
LRELAILQGFPASYQFGGTSLSNMYRHIGDAVPPLISYQLAHLVRWMFTGARPEPADFVLPGTSLGSSDIRRVDPVFQLTRFETAAKSPEQVGPFG